MQRYSLDFMYTCKGSLWQTDTGLEVIFTAITGINSKGESAHFHFEVVATKKTIVRTLDEIQNFIKI